jgi:hypothetical protein
MSGVGTLFHALVGKEEGRGGFLGGSVWQLAVWVLSPCCFCGFAGVVLGLSVMCYHPLVLLVVSALFV